MPAPIPAWRRWLGVPIITVLVCVAIVVGMHWFMPDLDGGTRMLVGISTAGVCLAIVSFWLLFLTGMSRRTRRVIFALEVLPFLLLRLDGYTGDLRPILAWRWSPKPDRMLAAQQRPNDLADTTERVALTPSEHDFSQFLGPARTGHIDGVRLARDWSTPPQELWRHKIGAGWSGFVVVGDFAITQEQLADLEAVTCYELETGKLRWRHDDAGRFSSVMGGDGPRATPTVDGGRVYAMGASGLLNCLDGANGRVVWSRDIVKENGDRLPTWGTSCSPLVVDDKVIVTAGGDDGNSLFALERNTGAVVWKAGNSPMSYASPVLATLDGVRQIVMVNAGDVMGFDLATGKVLWHYDWPGNQPKVPQPIPIDDHRVFIGAGYGLGCKLLEVPPSGDSPVTPSEVWSSLKLKPKFTNVMVHDGYVYGIDDGGPIVCLEVATGKLQWRSPRSAKYGHGQMLLVGDLLLVQCETGDVALVEASPERHYELARFTALPAAERNWNDPTLAGEYLLLRNDQEAVCYRLPLAE